MKSVIAFAFAAGLLLANGAIAETELPYADDASSVRPLRVGDTVPAVTLQGFDGSDVELAGILKGKPTLLVFYRGGWCPYCNRQLVGLQKIAPELATAGYQIIAVSPDSKASAANAAAENSIGFPVLTDPRMEAIRKFGLAFKLDAKTLKKYDGYGIKLQDTPGVTDKILPVPTVYLVSKEGRVLYIDYDADYTKRTAPEAILAAARMDLSFVEYRDGDTVLEGYLAVPAGLEKPVPGVAVIHEWWGRNNYAAKRARMLAQQGYVGFAVDVYGKGILETTYEGAGKQAGKYKGDRALMRRRCRAGLDVLRNHPLSDDNALAAVGYCFGGTCALELARDGAELDAVVSFHGGLDAPVRAKAGEVKADVLICHGEVDPYVPAEDVAAAKAEMEATGATWKFESYPGAVHSFTSPEAGDDPSKGAAYNAAADAKSWETMKAFLTEAFSQ